MDDYQIKSYKPDIRSKSLPRPAKNKPDFGPRRDFESQRYFEYDEDQEMYEMHDLHDVDYENYRERKALEERDRKRRENEFVPRDRGYDPEDEDFEFDIPRRVRPGYDRRYIVSYIHKY